MPACFIAFERDAFWCRDEAMQVWAALLAAELATAAAPPHDRAQPAPADADLARQDWARALFSSLYQLATLSFDGGGLQLSDYLETPARRALMLHLSQRSRARLLDGGLSVLAELTSPAARTLLLNDPAGACRRVLRAADTMTWLIGGERVVLSPDLSRLCQPRAPTAAKRSAMEH